MVLAFFSLGKFTIYFFKIYFSVLKIMMIIYYFSQSQNKAKHEDNSIEGQIKRDLWEELRAAEPEVLLLLLLCI